MRCYNHQFITRLGDQIGKTLRVDLNTLSDYDGGGLRVGKGRYARICVELDLQKRLVPKVLVANKVYNVEYEGLNVICFSCGRYGHRRDSCLNTYVAGSKKEGENVAYQEKQSMAALSLPVMAATPSANEKFGAWMIVGKNQKTRLARREFSVERNKEQGIGTKVVRKEKGGNFQTRFSVLSDVREEDDGREAEPVIGFEERSSNRLVEIGKELVVYQGEGRLALQVGSGGPRKKSKGSEEMHRENKGEKFLGKENVKLNGPVSVGKAQWSDKTKKAATGIKESGANEKSHQKQRLGQRAHVVISGSINEVGSSAAVKNK